VSAARPTSIALALGAVVLVAGVPHLDADDRKADDRKSSRRTGRAVRVPRTTSTISTAARFCNLSEDDRGNCWGAAVQVGETGTVLSTDGSNWGQTEILEVTPNLNRCGVAESWSIRIDRSRLQSSYYDYGATMVLGMTLTSEATLLSTSRPTPDENEGASINTVVDADGDSQPDLIADQYPCDLNRRLITTGDPTHQCYEYWVAVRERWQRGRVDQVATCLR
jgi:hypothetical protein